MIYIVDIDNTICVTENSNYKGSIPIFSRIEYINQLYRDNNIIIYWTARGSNSGIDWKNFTEEQLNEWGCLKHQLIMSKPHYDKWIDDKACDLKLFFNELE